MAQRRRRRSSSSSNSTSSSSSSSSSSSISTSSSRSSNSISVSNSSSSSSSNSSISISNNSIRSSISISNSSSSSSNGGQSQPVNGNQEKASSSNKDFQKAVPFSRKCFGCGDSSHLARSCPRNKTSCYNCGKEGHRAANRKAERKTPKSEQSSVNNMTDEGEIVKSEKRSGLIFKDVSFNGKSPSALIDTGSDLCIIRYDMLNTLSPDVDLSSEQRQLMGIGISKVTTMGCFTTSIEIDNIKLEIKFHVVRKRDIKYAPVIDNDVLRQVDLFVTEDGAEFRQRKKVEEKPQSKE
ncbi:putative uncharacterized protein DDB_G0277255 [Bactrocera tryoni]|uniref:putative uncharacterized protein DDB_G0277255 n=1 Tax=Bactrocera tryoni TaxID=59916 RepID=UPI001A971F14|nr:putative uncharacterized protein DDB_G0277255 [Bactrocera tryoni]